MKYKVTANFPTLHAVTQYDEEGSSEPYLWISIITYDQKSIDSGLVISTRSLVAGNSNVRDAFADGVDDNEDVTIPFRSSVFILDDGNGSLSDFIMLGFIVVLMEEDSTRDGAITAGLQAFNNALQEQMTAFGHTHISAPNAEERAAINEVVQDATESAIRSYYKVIDKLFAIGKNQDDFIGSTSLTFSGINHIRENSGRQMAFPLILKDVIDPFGGRKIGTNEYLLKGAVFTIEEVVADPCANQAQRLKDTQQHVKDIENRIALQQAKLRTASASQKPIINKEILRLRTQELAPANAAVVTAQRALDVCRNAH